MIIVKLEKDHHLKVIRDNDKGIIKIVDIEENSPKMKKIDIFRINKKDKKKIENGDITERDFIDKNKLSKNKLSNDSIKGKNAMKA